MGTFALPCIYETLSLRLLLIRYFNLLFFLLNV